jgi:ectoine hydroxylase-related dioxygenase (phytanoyl-CoA dioxygenase family)
MEFTPLTEDQRERFERDGFLVIPDALSEPLVERLLLAVDRCYEKGLREEGLNERGYWQMRNCLMEDEAFLPLLDHGAAVPLVAQILGPNIQLITSHLIVRPPCPEGTPLDFRQTHWHRDGGTSSSDLGGFPQRMFIKVSYWLTDLSEANRGAIRLVPGSNNRPEKPAPARDGDLQGAVELRVKPGTAVLFENRTYHAVGPNLSDITRKSLFFGYGYRWLRPMDYAQMPDSLLSRCDPVRRQLLGDSTGPMGFQLPTEEEVPLKNWFEAHGLATVSRGSMLPGTFASAAK